MYRCLIFLPLVAMVVLAYATPVWADDVHQGTVVSAGNGELTMTVNGESHSHKIGAKVAITRDGKEAQLDDLKKGDKVKVTTKKSGDTVTVVAIEATSAK